MNMIRWYTILLLTFVLFFGCAENKKAVTISEKDIEGYWVSGYLLHNTELSRNMVAGSAKKPETLLLRLKNEVNGFTAISYKLNDNILTYITEPPRLVLIDSIMSSGGKITVFLITFFSKERLILKDLRTLQETTYYNLSIIPSLSDPFQEIKFSGNIIVNDSIALGDQFSQKQIKINDKWKNDLNMITQRINWNAVLFATDAYDPQTITLGEFKMQVREGSAHIGINVKTSKHSGQWKFMSKYVSDPALSVLINEMLIFENYCYFNKLLPLYNRE